MEKLIELHPWLPMYMGACVVVIGAALFIAAGLILDARYGQKKHK